MSVTSWQSVDPLDDNRDFAKKTKADFPMLSDPSKSVAKAYDVLNVFRVASSSYVLY